MYNCYNCRKDFDEDPPHLFGNEAYCNSCKKYMPSSVQNKPVITNKEIVKPVVIMEEPKKIETKEIKQFKEPTKKLSGYEPYKYFKCNGCGSYYDNLFTSYGNMMNAMNCCGKSFTPYVYCKHRYRWRTIYDANKCCKIDENSLELKE